MGRGGLTHIVVVHASTLISCAERHAVVVDRLRSAARRPDGEGLLECQVLGREDLSFSKRKPCICTILGDSRDVDDTHHTTVFSWYVGHHWDWDWDSASLSDHLRLDSSLFLRQLVFALLLSHRFLPFSLFFALLSVYGLLLLSFLLLLLPLVLLLLLELLLLSLSLLLFLGILEHFVHEIFLVDADAVRKLDVQDCRLVGVRVDVGVSVAILAGSDCWKGAANVIACGKCVLSLNWSSRG